MSSVSQSHSLSVCHPACTFMFLSSIVLVFLHKHTCRPTWRHFDTPNTDEVIGKVSVSGISANVFRTSVITLTLAVY